MHNSTKDPRNERSQPKLETTYASTEARIDGRNLKSIRAGGTLRRMPVRTGHRRLPHDGGTITPAGVARYPSAARTRTPGAPEYSHPTAIPQEWINSEHPIPSPWQLTSGCGRPTRAFRLRQPRRSRLSSKKDLTHCFVAS